MKHLDTRRRNRISILATLAIVAGMFMPVALDATPAEAAYGAMTQPVTGTVTGVLSNRCGSYDSNHAGIDIAGNSGYSIKAAYSGKVTAAGYHAGYGNYVLLSHPGGYTTRYAHMNARPRVSVGQTVSGGQLLGYVGNTGNSYGAHLHFEVYRNGTNIGSKLGFTCRERITQGTAIPYSFPGLGSSASFDYNGDGRDDILAVSTSNTLHAYLDNGAGGWNNLEVGGGWGSTRFILHGDYNGDGRGDITAIRNDGTLWHYRGNGAGGFSSSEQVGHGWGAMSLVAGGADFNNDGRQDLISRDSAGDLIAYFGDGTGSFPNSRKIGHNWNAITALVAGDFNGDGKGDVIARRNDGLLFFYAGNGSDLNSGAQAGHGWNGMTAISGGADYTRDGSADVLARDAAGKLWIYPGGGNGTSWGQARLVGSGWNTHRLIS